MIVAPHWKLRHYLKEMRLDADSPNTRHDARLYVLLAMILHANTRMRCWPSTETLSDETGFNSACIVESRDWLIAKKALVLVPYDKRVGDECALPSRQFVYQLTGVMMTSDGLQPYLVMSDEVQAQVAHELEQLEFKVLQSEVSQSEISVCKAKGITSSKGIRTKSKAVPMARQDEPPSGGHPKIDSAFGFTVGQPVYYVDEPQLGIINVMAGTVERFTGKKVWVAFEDKSRCLAPRSLKAERPTLVRKTDEFEDIILEYSVHIPLDQAVGRSAAQYASDVKGQLLRMYPWLKPEQLRAAYAEKGEFAPTQKHLVISMVGAYVKAHKLGTNGKITVPILPHFPRGIDGCSECGGTGQTFGLRGESVPCKLCLEAEARDGRQAAG